MNADAIKRQFCQRIRENYEDFLRDWLSRPPEELVARAEEISAAKMLSEALPETVSTEDMEFLLQFENPLEVMSSKWAEENGSTAVHDDELTHCIWSLRESEEVTTGELIVQLIDRAKREFEVYRQGVLLKPKEEIFKQSVETAIKENLLSACINDSFDLEDDDLLKILEQKNPLDALCQFLQSGDTSLTSESGISRIVEEYNGSVQEKSDAPVTEQGVTMC